MKICFREDSYSPTFEIQDPYSKSIADGVFNMHLFDRGMRELYEQKFDLSEIFGTYVYEDMSVTLSLTTMRHAQTTLDRQMKI